MSAHTPGPWVARPDPNGSSTDWVIGTTNEKLPVDEVAVCNAKDARLIAAAPELLEAAKEFAENFLRDELDDPELCFSDRHHAAIRSLFDAIAKAEGKP